jgi:hypothetical protein
LYLEKKERRKEKIRREEKKKKREKKREEKRKKEKREVQCYNYPVLCEGGLSDYRCCAK